MVRRDVLGHATSRDALLLLEVVSRLKQFLPSSVLDQMASRQEERQANRSAGGRFRSVSLVSDEIPTPLGLDAQTQLFGGGIE